MIIKSILKVLGPKAVPFVYRFIENNKQFLKRISLPIQLNTIGNYVYLTDKGNYSILDGMNGEMLFETYRNYVTNYKKSYNTDNYIEHNKIIWDGRINGFGYYWIDLEKEFCIESMIRMQDCGRVNYGNTTLELREQKSNNNESHMIVVYEVKTGYIKQIKGKQNTKPKLKYWDYLYKLLMESDYTFNQYIPTYKPENDLLISDLQDSQQFTIYCKHPNLKKIRNLT